MHSVISRPYAPYFYLTPSRLTLTYTIRKCMRFFRQNEEDES